MISDYFFLQMVSNIQFLLWVSSRKSNPLKSLSNLVNVAKNYNITSSLLREQIHDNMEFDPIHLLVEFLQLILSDPPGPQ